MKLKALLFMLVTALAAPAALAGNIAGIWKHSEEAGWIEIRIVDGVASYINNIATYENYCASICLKLRLNCASGGFREQLLKERNQ